MSSTLALETTPSLESVYQEFEHWRKTRTKQGKIPPYLWKQVGALLEHYSMSEVGRALKINHGQIQDNLKNTRAHEDNSCQIDFVEISAATPEPKKSKNHKLKTTSRQVAVSNRITIEHPGGASMHIEISSNAMLTAAIQTFIGVHS